MFQFLLGNKINEKVKILPKNFHFLISSPCTKDSMNDVHC